MGTISTYRAALVVYIFVDWNKGSARDCWQISLGYASASPRPKLFRLYGAKTVFSNLIVLYVC